MSRPVSLPLGNRAVPFGRGFSTHPQETPPESWAAQAIDFNGNGKESAVLTDRTGNFCPLPIFNMLISM